MDVEVKAPMDTELERKMTIIISAISAYIELERQSEATAEAKPEKKNI